MSVLPTTIDQILADQIRARFGTASKCPSSQEDSCNDAPVRGPCSCSGPETATLEERKMGVFATGLIGLMERCGGASQLHLHRPLRRRSAER
jgi:hypothetical protein